MTLLTPLLSSPGETKWKSGVHGSALLTPKNEGQNP